MEGWVKVHRKLSEWEWSCDPIILAFFIHLLIHASNRDTCWRGQQIKRGQVLFGRKKWSAMTGISEQSLRTCIKKLKSTNEITTESTTGYTIITICNYDFYQRSLTKSQPADQPPDQPSTNQPSTTSREGKEGKEEKEKKRRSTGKFVYEGMADFLQ